MECRTVGDAAARVNAAFRACLLGRWMRLRLRPLHGVSPSVELPHVDGAIEIVGNTGAMEQCYCLPGTPAECVIIQMGETNNAFECVAHADVRCRLLKDIEWLRVA